MFGEVWQHKDLIGQIPYGKPHGGGWYHQDKERKIMTLYGRSGDYGEPDFRFLDRIPGKLKGYSFVYANDWGDEERELDTSEVEWY